MLQLVTMECRELHMMDYDGLAYTTLPFKKSVQKSYQFLLSSIHFRKQVNWETDNDNLLLKPDNMSNS